MALVYATLISKGALTFCDVPLVQRDAVTAKLELLDLGYLAVCNE